MSKSPFGWSYPPGAENDPQAPYNQTDDGTTQLQDEIMTMLIKASIPEAHIDSIMQAVAAAEQERQDLEDSKIVDELAEAERLERDEDSFPDPEEEPK